MFYAVAYRLKKSINPHLFPFHLFSVFFIVIPFLIVVVKSFTPYTGSSLSDNYAFINELLFLSLIRSVSVAFLTLVFVVSISYPFAYLIATVRSRTKRILIMSLVTCPLWSSFFVKLIGLKSFFDLIYGEMNSTRGLLYVIIGLVYINLPIAILTFYNSIIHIPKNIVNASLDLGSTQMETIWNIVVPYTYKAIMAVVFLVFLPSIACISVADFMNKSTGNKLVAQVIGELFSGGSNGIGIHRLAFVTLFLSAIIVVTYLICKYLFKGIRKCVELRNV